MVDKNSNTSSNNFESERELPDFSTLKPFDMEPRKKVNNRNYTQYYCQPKQVLSEQKFGHNSWHKCGRFCNPIETEEESLHCRENSKILEENYNGNFCVCVCLK